MHCICLSSAICFGNVALLLGLQIAFQVTLGFHGEMSVHLHMALRGAHVRQLVGDSFVTVDAGPLAAYEKPLMGLGCPLRLPGEVHGFFRMAIAAFQTIIGLKARPFPLSQFPALGEKLIACVYGANQPAPNCSGGLHFTGNRVRPLMGHMTI